MSSSKDMAAIRRALFGGNTAIGSIYATVGSVDPDARTVTATDDNDMTYDDVRLYAVERPELKGSVVLPKVGSRVLLSRIGTSNELYVSMFSEVDRMLLTIGDKQSVEVTEGLLEAKTDKSNLRITPEGFTIVRDGAGLKKTLTDLCEAIGRLTVTTQSGPSGVPINAAEFSAIKQELNKYLED